MSIENKNTSQVVLDHVGIVGRDIEDTSRMLNSVMRLGPWEATRFWEIRQEDAASSDEVFGVKQMTCNLGVSNIELIQPVDSPLSIWAQHIKNHGEGIHHLAINTKIYSELVSRLENKGAVKVVEATLPPGMPQGRWCYMVTSPSNIVLEIRDMGKGSTFYSESAPEIVFDHVNIVGEDTVKTANFLTEVFGLGPFTSLPPGIYRSPKECMIIGEPFVEKPLLSKGGPVTLKLIQPIKNSDSLWERHIKQHGEGIHHIGFRTTNLDSIISRVMGSGGKVLAEGKTEEGRWAYAITEPGNIVVEIVEKK